jgi:DnaK suppressor protein
MDKNELKVIKESLLKMRQEVMVEVQGKYAASREMGDEGNLPDLADASSNAYHRELLLNLSETQHQKMRDIDAALARLAQGEYGICAHCGEDISPRRMEVRPFSRYCIDCKTDIEKFGQ